MTNPIMECDDLKNLMEMRDGCVAVCVILRGRGANSQTQLVTYGETAEDKVQSHDLKEFIKDAMFAGYVPAATVHESFILDAAKVKQQRDDLLATVELILGFDDISSLLEDICNKAIAKAEQPKGGAA